ncbi:hypothetical protein BGW37DRAFT_429107 [Umbelopsis sp. PMI_123]|nr:hypothetical protein BGW37DRAFT_429107 [Umbelopsis sp. PMI_123]
MLISIASAIPAVESPTAIWTYPTLVGRAESGTATTTTTTTATTTKAKKSNFVSAPILETGTLFYVGVAATVVLWSSGKSIDYALQRQERYARYLATK